MPRTTEWVVECYNEDGDIVDNDYFPTEREARHYFETLICEGEKKLAKVTNNWDRHDRDNLLDREYDYNV